MSRVSGPHCLCIRCVRRRAQAVPLRCDASALGRTGECGCARCCMADPGRAARSLPSRRPENTNPQTIHRLCPARVCRHIQGTAPEGRSPATSPRPEPPRTRGTRPRHRTACERLRAFPESLQSYAPPRGYSPLRRAPLRRALLRHPLQSYAPALLVRPPSSITLTTGYKIRGSCCTAHRPVFRDGSDRRARSCHRAHAPAVR